MAAGTAPNPAAQAVGRLPQTTQGIPAGGPFIRYAAPDIGQAYVTTPAFGGIVTLPLTAQPGFLRGLIIKIAATGGSGATVVTAAGDAPWNVISQLTFKDSQGTTIFPAIDGYSLYLINLYSAVLGVGGRQAPTALPSYSAIQTTSGSGAGNFTFRIWVPLEAASSGYCSLPIDNAAELPRLTVQLNGTSTVYTTAPATLPTLTMTVEEPYWGVPNNMPDLAPFDVGASFQWILFNSASFSTGSSTRVLDGGVGQFIANKIYILRDNNNARQDAYPTEPIWYIDGFPQRDEQSDTRFDIMYKRFGVTRPTGVYVFDRRDSLEEFEATDADDFEDVLVTTGSTKLELAGTWGTAGTGPYTLTSLTGQIFPGPSGFPFGAQSS